MAYKYTGKARTFTFNDRIYADPKIFDKRFHHASYDTPIAGMTKERALRYAERSNLHSFEDTSDGEDLLEKSTTPFMDVPDGDISTVKPEALKQTQTGAKN